MRTFDEIRADVKTSFRRRDEPMLVRLAEEFDTLATDIASGWANNVRGTHAVWRGDLDLAITYFEKALAIFTSTEHPASDPSSVSSNMGTVYARKGDSEQALLYFRKALDAFLSRNDMENAANVYLNLGTVHFQLTEYAMALEMFNRSLDMFEQLNEPGGVRTSLSNIGSAYTESGDMVNGLTYFLRAVQMFEEAGLDRRAIDPLTNIGVVYRSTGRYEDALTYHLRALDLARTTQDRYAEITILRELGKVASLMGKHDEACTHYEQSASTAHEVSAPIEEAHSIVMLCSSLVQAGRHGEASDLLSQHRAMIDAHRMPRALALNVQASLHRHRSELQEALALYQQAIDALTLLQAKTAVEEVLGEATRLARELADFDLYVKYSEEQQRLKEEIRGQDATRRLTMVEAEQRIQVERAEKERHRTLLHSTLPPSIADRVMRGETVNDAIDHAAVMFMDMVGFTTMASTMPADEVVALLSEIFTLCDAVMAEHDVMKIKTIGDSYMAAAFGDDAVVRSARAALAMTTMLPARFPDLRFRIGLHCGPVTAGVIGTERLQYDVWGDTVNVASRMESSGEAGRVHVSRAVADALRDQEYNTECRIEERGEVEIKGKGSMVTYWVS